MAYMVLKLVACAKTAKYSFGSMFHLVKSLEELELVSVIICVKSLTSIDATSLVPSGTRSTVLGFPRIVLFIAPFGNIAKSSERLSQNGLAIASTVYGTHEEELVDEEEKSQHDIDEAVKSLEFEPLDPLTLGSFPLVAVRVKKLLGNRANNTHAYTNALPAIGCQNPTRADRRLFRRQIINMERHGLIERVFVPSKMARNKMIICIRPTVGDPDISHNSSEETLAKWNVTIHRQLTEIADILSQRGKTHNEMTALLSQFNVWTIEHLMKKNEEHPVPHHLRHFAIVSEAMHYGRECHMEYWTKSVLQRSQLDPNAVTEKLGNILAEDLSDVASFGEFLEEEFYDGDVDTLAKYVDNFCRPTMKRDRRTSLKADGIPRNRNPILPDGTVKKGCPRKEWSVPEKKTNAIRNIPSSPPAATHETTQGGDLTLGRSREGTSNNGNSVNSRLIGGGLPEQSILINDQRPGIIEDPMLKSTRKATKRPAIAGLSEKIQLNVHNPGATKAHSRKGIRAPRNANLTALRRQEELLTVLQDLGGIAHLSEDRIYEQFQKVIKRRIADGVVMSTPEGMSLDPQTLSKTMNSLSDRGPSPCLVPSSKRDFLSSCLDINTRAYDEPDLTFWKEITGALLDAINSFMEEGGAEEVMERKTAITRLAKPSGPYFEKWPQSHSQKRTLVQFLRLDDVSVGTMTSTSLLETPAPSSELAGATSRNQFGEHSQRYFLLSLVTVHLKFRGSTNLPDDHPDDPVNFDSLTHVDFLRSYIDKGKLRAGVIDQATKLFGATLPKSICPIAQRFGYTDDSQSYDPKFDYFLTTVGDENALCSDPFVMRSASDAPSTGGPRIRGLTQAAIKARLCEMGPKPIDLIHNLR
ncbi:uncharacterized protein EI90DRAFT_3158840 [Cantharellus anzutake]|uniref:uncharacterized protein n=1 Tax=Cantharellus anzutake TaxID=1750568 RepID=UPI001904FFB4|nr:uncharacterized protein EI90DRAFT_3158840 [Cantharellus anzutake]KAF8316731.1 hypothetical protein EI90DRAFT_3158840 [Cantharellus anzutake]